MIDKFKIPKGNIFTTSGKELGRWGRFAAFQVRLWPKCINLLKQNKSGTQAAALSYHTIFGIVPLAIVMLMVFQALPAYKGIGDEVKNFMYEQFELSNIQYTGLGESAETVKLVDKIDDITNTFIANLNKGLVTLLSGIIVVWAALGLLMTIERSFNSIWHVSKGRSFIIRIINYWALLTLGPLLLGLGIYATTQFVMFKEYQAAIGFLKPIVPYLISVVALFLLYFMMPNTRVSPKAALWGAVIAALIWAGAKQLFSIYVLKAIPYAKVYGVMGLIPLGVFWIWVTWLIVLFGLQLTYTTQHLKKLDAEELASMQRGGDYFMVNDFAIIRILKFILQEFEEKRAPVSAQLICGRLNLPPEFGEDILQHLVDHGLLLKTDEPDIGYAPATDGANITLSEIAMAALQGSFVQREEDKPGKLKEIIDAYHQELTRHTLKDVLDKPEPTESA